MRGRKDDSNAGEKEATNYERPASYFPARVHQNQNSLKASIEISQTKFPRTNLSNRSKAATSKISRVEVLTKDCLWPLVALVSAVLALLLYVLGLLVIIANCLK